LRPLGFFHVYLPRFFFLFGFSIFYIIKLLFSDLVAGIFNDLVKSLEMPLFVIPAKFPMPRLRRGRYPRMAEKGVFFNECP